MFGLSALGSILAGLAALFSQVFLYFTGYFKGKDAMTKEALGKALEGAKEANETLDKIRKLSDRALDDKLRQ